MPERYSTSEIDQTQKRLFRQAYESYLKRKSEEDEIVKKNNPKWLLDFEKKNVLTFANIDDAKVFVEELAQKKEPFLMFKVNSDGSVGGEFFLSTGDGKLHNGKISPELANRIVNSKNKLSGRELLPAILENNQKKIESLLNDPNPSHNSSLGM